MVILGALQQLNHEAVIKQFPAIPFLLIGETLKPLLSIANVVGLICEPFNHDVTTQLLHDCQQYQRMLPGEHKQSKSHKSFDGLVGETDAVKDVRFLIEQVAKTDANVLILGESGTGKEVVARNVHLLSKRNTGPFVPVNCGAIPGELLESELFGHEKGAFTGAQTTRQGRFEQADGGTLFLDEIGDMPLEAQTRLLRVLQESEFYRVGGTTPIHVDVRIIAATHQDLEKLVKEGDFREDLFHRLNVIRIHIPRMAERREDIPRLANYFLQRAGHELGVEPKILHKDTEKYLSAQAWPGNVRQLENTCRWLTVMASGREVLVDDLPPELKEAGAAKGADVSGDWLKSLRNWADRALSQGERSILEQAVPGFERTMIEVALQHTGGRKRDAAALLGWGRNTLTRKIKELDMEGQLSGGDED